MLGLLNLGLLEILPSAWHELHRLLVETSWLPLVESSRLEVGVGLTLLMLLGFLDVLVREVEHLTYFLTDLMWEFLDFGLGLN